VENFKQQLNEDYKAVLQVFADSSFRVRAAAGEKVHIIGKEIADISINRSRGCKGL